MASSKGQSMITIEKQKIFISGNFADSFREIKTLSEQLAACGFDAKFKMNDSGPSSESLIEDCDYFISVAGLEGGGIVTPNGDSLPQLELSYAMINRKPVIGLIKNPDEYSSFSRQEYFRSLLKIRLGEKVFPFTGTSDIKPIVDSLLLNGFDNSSEFIKPNKVFISHSSKDKPTVERMVKVLKTSGFLTFYDKHDIQVGISIKNTIRKALRTAGYVVLCLSNNATSSNWVRDEIKWALEHANDLGLDDIPFIYPVKIADFDVSDDLSFLQDIRYADVEANFEHGMNDLIGAMM